VCVAVGCGCHAIHADVTASHAAFGARLLETAGATQLAGLSYSAMDVEQNAKALAEVISDAVQS
jgi:hydroxymethylglutaryl-CoA reductase